MRNDLVLRVVAKLLIPFILLFALYVQFHGDFGPGGGFQAGVILAAAVIFYGLIFGLEDARKLANTVGVAYEDMRRFLDGVATLTYPARVKIRGVVA